MKAGRELDELIAEKVMGWSRQVKKGAAKMGYSLNMDNIKYLIPHYSTDIAAAWEVWEKAYCDCWHIGRNASGNYEVVNPYEDNYVVSEAPDAPLAICLAALKAVGVRVKI